jgi:hypothetical protein
VATFTFLESSENWCDLTKIGVITLCMGQAYKHLDAMVVAALDFWLSIQYIMTLIGL